MLGVNSQAVMKLRGGIGKPVPVGRDPQMCLSRHISSGLGARQNFRGPDSTCSAPVGREYTRREQTWQRSGSGPSGQGG